MASGDMTKRHEGCRLKAYLDSLGFLTVGYGHKCINREFDEITQEEAEELFRRDWAVTLQEALHLFPDWGDYSPNRQEAIRDMLFQLGCTGLRHFVKAVAWVRMGAWGEAAAQFRNSLWARQTPERAAENTKLIEEG